MTHTISKEDCNSSTPFKRFLDCKVGEFLYRYDPETFRLWKFQIVDRAQAGTGEVGLALESVECHHRYSNNLVNRTQLVVPWYLSRITIDEAGHPAMIATTPGELLGAVNEVQDFLGRFAGICQEWCDELVDDQTIDAEAAPAEQGAVIDYK